jgi:hypothetical protein
MTITLPSPSRMALALILIAALFVGAIAYGHSHRPAAHATVQPGLPVLVPNAASATAPAVTAPPGAPLLPALKVFTPGLAGARVARARGGI